MGGIRKVIREVGGELQEGISKAKGFLEKRARPVQSSRPPLAFALVPPQFTSAPKRVARPRRIKRRR